MNRSQKKLLWISLTIWFLSMGIGLAFARPISSTTPRMWLQSH